MTGIRLMPIVRLKTLSDATQRKQFPSRSQSSSNVIDESQDQDRDRQNVNWPDAVRTTRTSLCSCSSRGSRTIANRAHSSNRPNITNFNPTHTRRIGASSSTEQFDSISEGNIRTLPAIISIRTKPPTTRQKKNDQKNRETHIIQRTPRMSNLNKLHRSVRPRRDTQLRKPSRKLRDAPAPVPSLVVVAQQRDVEVCHVVTQSEVYVCQGPGVRGPHCDGAAAQGPGGAVVGGGGGLGYVGA